MENATQTDALEEDKTSEDATQEDTLKVSSRQQALEEIYERRAQEVEEETSGEPEEIQESPVWHDGDDWKTRKKLMEKK